MPAKSGRGGADVPGVKTNEREGTRAVLRHSRMSAYKVRQVLNLIRDKDVHPGRRDPGQRRPRGGHRGRARSWPRPWPTPSTTTGSTPRSSTCRPATPTRAAPSSAGVPGPVVGPPASASGPPHHHHREPDARRADRPPPGQAVRRRRPALAPGGRVAPAPAHRAGDVDHGHRGRADHDTGPRRGPRTPCRPTTWSPRPRPARWRSPTSRPRPPDRRGHGRRPPTATAAERPRRHRRRD